MGLKTFAQNALFRASVCGAAAYGAKLGSTPEAHTWIASKLPEFLGNGVSIQIPHVHLPTAHYLISAFPSISKVLFAVKCAAIPVALLYPTLEFINWLGRENHLPPHAKQIIDDSRDLYCPDKLDENISFDYITRNCLYNLTSMPDAVPTALPAHDKKIISQAGTIGPMAGVAPALHAAMSNDLNTLRRGLQSRPVIKIAENTVRGFEVLMDEFAPEFTFQRFTFRQAHAEIAVVRKVAMIVLADKAAKLGKPVVMVGGSMHQVACFPGVVHNHAPRLSGRDTHRQDHVYSPAVQTYAKVVCCQAPLQHCGHAFPGTTLVIPFAAQDINLRTVVKSMIANNQHDCLIAMHLPVPMLDDRITSYRDDDLGVRYERRDGKIFMYTTSVASAGYGNNETDMMSWARSMPSVRNYHVSLEEIRSIGSIYLFHLYVSKGLQEDYMSCFKVGASDFYVLPILKPDWRMHPDEDRHFVVPKNRFSNVVAFTSSVPASKNLFENVANKVRGQQSEIKIADKVILPRWELTPDEFGSVITHAIIRAEMMRKDHGIALEIGMNYLNWWYSKMEGGFWGRLGARAYNTVTLSNWRRTPRFFDRSRNRLLQDLLIKQRSGDGRMEDPYAEHGLYRIRHRVANLVTDFTDLEAFFAPVQGPPPAVLRVSPGPGFAQDFFRHQREKKSRKRAGWMISAPDWDYETTKHPVTLENFNVYMIPCWRMLWEDNVIISRGGDFYPDLRGLFRAEYAHRAEVEEESAETEREEEKKEERRNENSDSADQEGESEEKIEDERSDAPVRVVRSEGPRKEIESTPSTSQETTLGVGFEWPKPSTHAGLYQVRLTADDEEHMSQASISFKGALDFLPRPDHTASHQEFLNSYSSAGEVLAAVEKDPLTVIPCPDSGALALCGVICGGKSRRGDLWFDPRDEEGKDHTGEEEDSEVGASSLQEHIDSFWSKVIANCERRGNTYRKPSVILDGIPASAKSTLARMMIEGRNAIVVVPTRKLRKEWALRCDGRATVVTQHAIPDKDRFDVMVIDEANTLGRKVLGGWLALARGYRCRHIVVLGDSFQAAPRTEEDARFREQPLEGPTVQLKNSFTMPLDSLKAFLYVNGISGDRSYTTLSKVKRSIAILDRGEPLPSDFPRQDLYTRSRLQSQELEDPHGRVMVSITQSQGSRAERHYFASGLANGRQKWFQHMIAVQSILFTRHTSRLIVDMNVADFTDAFPAIPLENAPVHGGKSQSKLLRDRPRHPFDLDTLVMPHGSIGDALTNAALPLDFSLNAGSRLVTVNAQIDLPQIEKETQITGITSLRSALEVLIPRIQATSRREYKEEIDFVSGAAHGLISIGELGWGPDPVMRNHIPGVFNLGDIQVSRDRHNDLRNVLLRQLNERKPVNVGPQDVADAYQMFQLYSQTFMKEEVSMHVIGHMGYEYIATRTSAFINAWNDPFGFAASCVRRNAFLKTQVKVKPGLAGQETHGQTVVANEPELTNLFGPWARLGYYYMAVTDRDDFITDAGFSDEELSQRMQLSGMASRIESSGNLQVDLTRQDSTHRPSHVIAYCMFLEAAGVPEEVAQMYLALRSVMYIKSLSPNLYRAEARWNLASGDPFTLNANCFMMKCNLAVEYDGLENCAGVQKGDDFIASNEGWRRSARGGLRSRLRYGMKVDVNKPPYHAGRFLHQGVWLADPVRAFFRHFSKTFDPATTIEELYRSFMDRHVHYTPEQQEYLKKVVPAFYPDVTGEEAEYIVDTIANLRSFKNFHSTYKHATRHADRIFDPEEDCAYQVAAKFLPPHRNVLRRFRNIEDPEELLQLYHKHGVPAIRCAHAAFIPFGFVGAVISDKHVIACLPPRPTEL